MGFTFPGNPFGAPNLLVPLVMFAWIPIVLYMFSRLPARQAVVYSFLAAWLFLPEAEMQLSGLPDYSKTTATCYGILIATFIFDVGRFSTFKFSWLDIPMVVWCLSPFASALTNDFVPFAGYSPLYDGFSSSLDRTALWGVTYFLGRIYLNSWAGLRQLAIGIFLGGLAYVPLCLFESRFSPQLHRIFYGAFAAGDFSQTMRLGGFRPTVFMQHGLAVGAFMMASTLIGLWLWQTNTIRQVRGIPMGWLLGAMFLAFALLRSTGALALLMIGVAMLVVAKYLRTALPVFLLVAAMALYLYINAGTEIYFTDQLLDFLKQIFPEDRVASLEFRLNNEELLVDHARERLTFGWSGWNRSRVIVPETGKPAVQDSLWVIALGENGLVGLVSLFSAMLLPVVVLFWSRCPARLWMHPQVAPAVGVAVALVLYMLDCILNAMINPIYILACGGIAGLVVSPERKRQPSRKAAVSGRYAVQPR
ncbi:MAG: O-antigen ligase domain-containing protein [Cyanobacteria bacterium RM1_2_2]|nr:O-antigen ligase domain-containing protein [Cyanobacteria bacterium RM1_2_2]